MLSHFAWCLVTNFRQSRSGFQNGWDRLTDKGFTTSSSTPLKCQILKTKKSELKVFVPVLFLWRGVHWYIRLMLFQNDYSGLSLSVDRKRLFSFAWSYFNVESQAYTEVSLFPLTIHVWIYIYISKPRNDDGREYQYDIEQRTNSAKEGTRWK